MLYGSLVGWRPLAGPGVSELSGMKMQLNRWKALQRQNHHMSIRRGNHMTAKPERLKEAGNHAWVKGAKEEVFPFMSMWTIEF